MFNIYEFRDDFGKRAQRFVLNIRELKSNADTRSAYKLQ